MPYASHTTPLEGSNVGCGGRSNVRWIGRIPYNGMAP